MNKRINYIYFLILTSMFIYKIYALDANTRALLESESGQLFMARCGYTLLKNKGVEAAAASFAQAFNNQKSTKQLVQFLQQVKAGEQLFSLDMQQSQAYTQLLSTLEKHKTPLGTTLADWALRFLTFDALLLVQAEPTTPTDDLAHVVTEQFTDTLLALQRRFKFEVSADISTIVLEKERLFLRQHRDDQ